MAFGKSRPNMNFRQRAKGSTTRPKGGGKSAPFFINRYQPPMSPSTDLVRLIPGSYPALMLSERGEYVLDEAGQPISYNDPYLKYKLHYHGSKKRSAVCAGGPLKDVKGKADPCNGCDWFWYEYDIRKANNSERPKSMSRRDMWAFTVLVMAPFHKTNDVDEHGNLRLRDDGKTPFYHWEKCQGRGCEGCAQGLESKEGHRQHWSMGFNHFNNLLDSNIEIGSNCRVCGQMGCILSLAWICQNPQCGEAVIDMATSTLKDEEIDKLTSFEAICPHCQQKGFLSEIFECSNCKSAGKEGDRSTLFDENLTVKRVPGAEDTNQTTLNIVRSSGPVPIDPKYKDDLRKPLPLDKIFEPTDAARQESLFEKAPARGSDVQRTPVTSGTQQYS